MTTTSTRSFVVLSAETIEIRGCKVMRVMTRETTRRRVRHEQVANREGISRRLNWRTKQRLGAQPWMMTDAQVSREMRMLSNRRP